MPVLFLGSARPWASLEFEALQYYIEIHRYTRIAIFDPFIYNLFIHGMLYVVYIYILLTRGLWRREALGKCPVCPALGMALYNTNRGVGNMKKTNKIGHPLLPTTLLIIYYKCAFTI
jgi:hypothetical protein